MCREGARIGLATLLLVDTTGDDTGTAHLTETVDAVRSVLLERGIDLERTREILEAIAAVESAAMRRNLFGRWRIIARRHGTRPAADAAGLSRYQFLSLLAGIVDVPTLLDVLRDNLWRGELLTADEAEAAAAKIVPRP